MHSPKEPKNQTLISRRDKDLKTFHNYRLSNINISRIPSDLTSNFTQAEKLADDLKNDIERNFLTPEFKELLKKANEETTALKSNYKYSAKTDNDLSLSAQKSGSPQGISYINTEEFNRRLSVHSPLKQLSDGEKNLRKKIRSQSRE